VRMSGNLVILHHKDDDPRWDGARSGDVVVYASADFRGLMAMSGGHCNYGFSGVWRGGVWYRRKRHRLADWGDLFPDGEHKYPARKDMDLCLKFIREAVSANKGSVVLIGRPATKTGLAIFKNPFIPVGGAN